MNLIKNIFIITVMIFCASPAQAHISTAITGLYKDLSAAFKKWIMPQAQPEEKPTKALPKIEAHISLQEHACEGLLGFGILQWRSIFLTNKDNRHALISHAYAVAVGQCYSKKNRQAIRQKTSADFYKTIARYFTSPVQRVYENFEKNASTRELICMNGTLSMTKKLLRQVQTNQITQAKANTINYQNWQRCLYTRKATQFAKDFKKAQQEDALLKTQQAKPQTDLVRDFLDRIHSWQ